jgi:hypothetical protein
VLLGEPVVPEQILADWLSYRLLFDDLLVRFGALLARQAKAEKARLQEQLAEQPTERAPAPGVNGSRKADVRRRIAEARGLSAYRPSNRFSPPAKTLVLMPEPPATEPEEDEP